LRDKAICGTALALIIAMALLTIFNVQLSDAMIDTRKDSKAIDSPFFPSSWNKTYRGLHSDVVYSVAQTSDGGYALRGERGE